MTELFSQYASGVQWTAGTIVGSATGASGINPVVDRLNSVTTDNGIVIGSFAGTTVSGTSMSYYGDANISGTSATTFISGGQIDRVPTTGDDITNKSYVDSVGLVNKKEGEFFGTATSGTSMATFNFTRTKPYQLTIWSSEVSSAPVSYRLTFFNGGTKVGEMATTLNTISGTWNTQTSQFHSPQFENTILYSQIGGADSFNSFTSATAQFKQGFVEFSTAPDTIQITAVETKDCGFEYEYYQT